MICFSTCKAPRSIWHGWLLLFPLFFPVLLPAAQTKQNEYMTLTDYVQDSFKIALLLPCNLQKVQLNKERLSPFVKWRTNIIQWRCLNLHPEVIYYRYTPLNASSPSLSLSSLLTISPLLSLSLSLYLYPKLSSFLSASSLSLLKNRILTRIHL